ncbi:MAG: ABC-type transport auxiliary lipoprotein family protein [Thermodesulfobacteriota bacterium]
MPRTSKAALILAIFLIFSPGCLSGIQTQDPPPIHYYTLEYDPPELNKIQLPSVLNIQEFSAGPNCNTDKLVYNPAERTRENYHYHRWRSSPGDLVTYFLRRDLQQGRLFSAVSGPGFDSRCTHRLQGLVEEFYEMNKDNKSYAVAQMSITLLQCNQKDISQRVLTQETYRAREEMDRATPGQLAKAMSKVMQKLSKQISRDVYQELEGN